MLNTALRGVGDQQRQMFQKNVTPARVMHLKRHLTDAEIKITGPVKDIRRTPEALARVKVMALVLNADIDELRGWEPGVL